MSTTDSNNISIPKKIVWKIGYFSLIAFFIILFWFFRNIQVDKMISRQQQQISQTIINTVNEQAKLDLLMPDVVFINIGDSTHKKQLNDTLAKQIATVLTQKYIGNEKIDPSEIDLQPFFVFPDSSDNNGNYTLTKVQLEKLKNHIQFLTIQIDKAVIETKDEINREINMINTWVTLWIGVLAIFGTIIPLFYNYKNNEDLKRIKTDASAAQTKADEAHTMAKEIKTEIDKVKDVPADLVKLKNSFGGFEDDVKKAKKDSGEAIVNAISAIEKSNKVEKLVLALNDISKIKDIDASFLLYNKEPLAALKLLLVDVHSSLININNDLYSHPMVRDIFRQLALRVHLISFTYFVSPANFDLLNQFALDVSKIITQPLTEVTYNQILILLNTLNTNFTSQPSFT